METLLSCPSLARRASVANTESHFETKPRLTLETKGVNQPENIIADYRVHSAGGDNSAAAGTPADGEPLSDEFQPRILDGRGLTYNCQT